MIVELKVAGVGNLSGLSAKKLKSKVLIYGDNGAGKSTLAAIFRSLQANDATVITDRRTVGLEIDADILLTSDKEEYSFKDGDWSAGLADAYVFDQSYVNRNIHSGDVMSNDHGKSLYSIILGESCGKLLDDFEAMEGQIDEHNKKLRGLSKDLESRVPQGLALEQFLGLKESSSLEDDIRRQEERVETLRKRKKLDRADGFAKIEFPQLSESYEKVLQKSFGNFLDDAEQKVIAHVEDHTKSASLAWLEQGCEHSNDDDCPFCGQSLGKVELLAAYKSFFSREYNTLKAEVNGLGGLVDAAYGERVVVNQQKILSENKAATQFWEDFIEVPPLDESLFEELGDEIGRSREKLNDLAETKKQNLTEAVELDVDLTFGSSLQERLDDYNTLIDVANERIEELRKAQSTGNVEEENSKLIGLRATGARYESEVVQLIDDWKVAGTQKEKLSKQRKTLQKSIREETKEVFAARGEMINQLLDSFETGYRLGEFDTNNRTKPPSVQIRVCFEGQEESVRLDDKASDSERPFDAALSAGERSLLAFTFFLSDLAKDAEIENKVVVIDDPITNLDQKRLARAAEAVADIAGKAKQLILLSHSQTFLDGVADKLKSKETQRMQLVKNPDGIELIAAS